MAARRNFWHNYFSQDATAFTISRSQFSLAQITSKYRSDDLWCNRSDNFYFLFKFWTNTNRKQTTIRLQTVKKYNTDLSSMRWYLIETQVTSDTPIQGIREKNVQRKSAIVWCGVKYYCDVNAVYFSQLFVTIRRNKMTLSVINKALASWYAFVSHSAKSGIIGFLTSLGKIAISPDCDVQIGWNKRH